MRTIVLTGALCIGATWGGAAIDTYLHAAPSAVEIESAESIPPGTDLTVALRQAVGARVNGVGDRIAVDLVQPIATREGEVVVPIGSTIHGRITAIARPATRGNQVAIAIRFDELMHEGRALPLVAEVTEVEPAPPGQARDAVPTIRVRPAPGVGKVLSVDKAISHTGIEAGPANGTVVALGMGDVEPVLFAGTLLTLRTTAGVGLKE